MARLEPPSEMFPPPVLGSPIAEDAVQMLATTAFVAAAGMIAATPNHHINGVDTVIAAPAVHAPDVIGPGIMMPTSPPAVADVGGDAKIFDPADVLDFGDGVQMVLTAHADVQDLGETIEMTIAALDVGGDDVVPIAVDNLGGGSEIIAASSAPSNLEDDAAINFVPTEGGARMNRLAAPNPPRVIIAAAAAQNLEDGVGNPIVVALIPEGGATPNPAPGAVMMDPVGGALAAPAPALTIPAPAILAATPNPAPGAAMMVPTGGNAPVVARPAVPPAAPLALAHARAQDMLDKALRGPALRKSDFPFRIFW